MKIEVIKIELAIEDMYNSVAYPNIGLFIVNNNEIVLVYNMSNLRSVVFCGYINDNQELLKGNTEETNEKGTVTESFALELATVLTRKQ
tara:strand:+ start:39 stop:305 length:267 start_codon:yes stop_codon:yes gene_type:complete